MSLLQTQPANSSNGTWSLIGPWHLFYIEPLSTPFLVAWFPFAVAAVCGVSLAALPPRSPPCAWIALLQLVFAIACCRVRTSTAMARGSGVARHLLLAYVLWHILHHNDTRTWRCTSKRISVRRAQHTPPSRNIMCIWDSSLSNKLLQGQDHHRRQ